MSKTDYPGNQSVLSREETELYSVLENNGIVRRITATHDLGTVKIFEDADLETALALLEESTSAMVAQTRVLRLQQEALNEFQATNHQAQIQSKRITGYRQRHRIQEKQNTDLAIEELLQTTVYNATLAQRQSQAHYDAYPKIVAESVRQDDSILEKLENVSAAHSIDESDEHQKSRIQDLCARLIMFDTEEIRCRLDRIYIETIRSSSNTNASQSTQASNLVSSLKEELGSLYPEISAVSQMSVSQEFEAPLTQSIEQRIFCRDERIRSALDDILATLSHLEKKTTHLTSRMLTNDLHLAALNNIVHDVEALQLEDSQSTMITSPIKNNGDTRSLPSQSTPGHSLDSILQQESFSNSGDAYHRQMLHLLGVPLSNPSLPEVQNTLDAAISDRQQKLREGLKGLNHAIDRSLSLELNNAACVNDLLLNGLLEDSKTHTVELFDPELKSRSSKLGKELDKVGSDIAGLELDKLHMPSGKRDDFVNKWAS